MGNRPPEKRPNVLPVSPKLAAYRRRLAEGTVKSKMAYRPPEGTPEYEAYRRHRAELGAKGSRKGIPHGWGGRKDELQRVREKAREKAKEIVAMAIENDQVDPIIKDDEHARTAMEFLVSVVVAQDDAGKPAESTADRIKAAAQVLQYTKTKPVTTVNATVRTAEDWLASLSVD